MEAQLLWAPEVVCWGAPPEGCILLRSAPRNGQSPGCGRRDACSTAAGSGFGLDSSNGGGKVTSAFPRLPQPPGSPWAAPPPDGDIPAAERQRFVPSRCSWWLSCKDYQLLHICRRCSTGLSQHLARRAAKDDWFPKDCRHVNEDMDLFFAE